MRLNILHNADITQVKSGVILHACNCFHTMGAGAAKALRNKWPQIYQTDTNRTSYGDKTKLGTYSVTSISPRLTILNCYTQYRYGRDKRYTNYEAVYSCLEKTRDNFPDQELHMTPLGCGLAGGDWEVVKAMVLSVFKNTDTIVNVYFL